MENENLNGPVRNQGRIVGIVIVAALFIIGIVQVLNGSGNLVTAEIDQVHLGVCGTYGQTLFLELDAITEVQMVDSFDFGTCVEGEATSGTVSGIYSCEAYGQYTVHVNTKVPVCIVVTHPEGTLVFNCSSESLTEKMYDKLVAATAA